MQKEILSSTDRAYSFKWLLFTITLVLRLPNFSFAQEITTPLPSITLNQPAITNIFGTDWSPDGQFLAVATNSGAWIFTPTLQKVAQLTTPVSLIYGVSWNADGTTLAIGGADNKVSIWDVKNLNHISLVSELTETYPVVDVKWNPNGIANQMAVQVVEKIDFFSDASVSYSTIHVWDVTTQKVVQTPIQNRADVTQVAWNPTGDQLAISYYNSQPEGSSYKIGIWDVQTTQWAIFPLNSFYQTWSMTWQPDSSLLATTDNSGSVSIYNENLELINGLELIEKIYSSSWNPTGTTLAVGTEGGFIQFWNMNSGESLAYIQAHTSTIDDLHWSPDGIHLVSSTYEGVLKIWDTGKLPTPQNLPTMTPFPPINH